MRGSAEEGYEVSQTLVQPPVRHGAFDSGLALGCARCPCRPVAEQCQKFFQERNLRSTLSPRLAARRHHSLQELPRSMAGDMNEDEMQRLYQWIDEMPLTGWMQGALEVRAPCTQARRSHHGLSSGIRVTESKGWLLTFNRERLGLR